MVNKSEHIDDFLNQKLEGFESMPDHATWEAIAADIEHLVHPIDQSLNQHLSDLSGTPGVGSKPAILGYAAIGNHPIDLALHEKLSVLESIPDRHVYQHALQSAHEGKRKKRRFVLWFSILFVAGLAGILARYSNNGFDKIKQADKAVLELSGTENKSDGKVPDPDHDNLNAIEDKDRAEPLLKSGKSVLPSRNRVPEMENESGHEEAILTDIHENPGNYSITLLNQRKEPFTPGMILSDAEQEDEMKQERPAIASIGLRKIQIVYQNHELRKILHPDLPRRRLSRLSINLQMGFANESVAGRQLKPDHVHQDAPSVFGRAYSKSANGDIFSVHFGYRLSSRFTVKAGFQRSSTVEKSNIDYVVYRQVPVYDDTGALTGYLNVTDKRFNEKVTTKTSSYSIPLQVYARVFESGKLSLWTGLGTDLLLSRSVKGRFFSFDDKAMKSYRSYSMNKLSPHLSLMCLYHLNPSIAITGNFQVSYLEDKLKFDRMTFVKHELMPSLRLGLLFTPIIAAK